MSDESETTGFFRCPVQPEQANAYLKIGLQKVPVTLCETSIDGFTITIAGRHSRRVRLGARSRIKTRSEYAEVHVEWLFHAPGGGIQIGLRRLRDLTPSEEPRRAVVMGRDMRSHGNAMGSSELVFAGLVIFLFLALSMPGLGDSLGTAPRIRGAVTAVASAVLNWR
jgi:hypothetical protein